MKTMLKKLPALAAVTIATELSMGATVAQEQDKTIILCWDA